MRMLLEASVIKIMNKSILGNNICVGNIYKKYIRKFNIFGFIFCAMAKNVDREYHDCAFI